MSGDGIGKPNTVLVLGALLVTVACSAEEPAEPSPAAETAGEEADLDAWDETAPPVEPVRGARSRPSPNSPSCSP